MSDHVAEWRQQGHWKSAFEDAVVDPRKRLMAEFWWKEDGSPTENLIRYINDPESTNDFIAYFLPHRVEFQWWDEDKDCSRVPHEWIMENCSGVWYSFLKSHRRYMYFEFPEDAFWFKMIWY
jgi:hypothetical protein